MKQILIADNSETYTSASLLQEAGFTVTIVHTTTQAIEWLQKNQCDLIISEVSFTDNTGFFLVRFLRKKLEDKRTPFIFVSEKKTTRHRIHGLKSGANDYIVKPFLHDEFLARVQVQLRIGFLMKHVAKENPRNSLGMLIEAKQDFSFGPFILQYKKVMLLKNGVQVPLTFQEFKLLIYLVEHCNQVIKKEDLLDKLWKYDLAVGMRTVYTHMSWLRDKLRTSEKPEGYIKTIRQVGYMFSLD